MSLLGRWSTSGSEGGNAHFLPLQEYDRGDNRTNEQTRTRCLGLTQEQKGSMQHYISDSIYGLTLAWITSENSTSNWNADILTRFSLTVAGPSCHAASSLCSAVHCRPPLSDSRRQLPVSSFSQPTLFRVLLPLPDTARFQVQKPFVWFRAKTDKGIVCLAGHPHSVTIVQYEAVLLN